MQISKAQKDLRGLSNAPLSGQDDLRELVTTYSETDYKHSKVKGTD